MPNNGERNNNEKIEEKLKALGLNLEEIPNILKETKPLNYRPISMQDENTYHVYKYLPVEEIQILLTPTDRTEEIKDKYKLASPVYSYLNPQTEEDIEKHATFLNMVNTTNLQEIDAIEEEQIQLNKQIPFEIKYENNYLWQIYYSYASNQYFMLVPTKDANYSAFLYLLKKQLKYAQTGKSEKIFVPISYLDYSEQFLKKSEIIDVENYLWLFTKEWPNIYEVYDKKEEARLVIVGTTMVYEGVKSIYKTTIESETQAQEFYKLLKALFILSTELPQYYQFLTKINQKHGIDFYYENNKMENQSLPEFIKMQVNRAEIQRQSTQEDMEALKDKLEELQQVSREKDLEYIEREKQIATFLECKRTFFGKVKYYFKYKAKKKNKEEEEVEELKTVEKTTKQGDSILGEFQNLKVKIEYYTIEDLIKEYREVDKLLNQLENIRLDTKALFYKIKAIDKKIENANLYIKEIDNHNKSIFDFWKFTNKDEKLFITAAQREEENANKKIEKVFDYENDLEELGKEVDKNQRKLLLDEETDAVFLTNTEIARDINALKQSALKDSELVKRTEELIAQAEQEKLFSENQDFDIFGSMSEDRTKVKVLGNKKHRETKKDKFKILGINKNTNSDEYKAKLWEIIKRLERVFNKAKSSYNMYIYKATDALEELDKEAYEVFYMNPEVALQQVDSKNRNLYKIHVKENTPIVFFSNIMFYDNINKTLPVGMHIKEAVLMDTKKLKLVSMKKVDFNRNIKVEDKIEINKVTVYEYEIRKEENNDQ